MRCRGHPKGYFRPGVSKVFARRATCGEMNICGAAFDYNTGRGLYSIHFTNQATRGGQNLIKGHIWPASRTLDIRPVARGGARGALAPPT